MARLLHIGKQAARLSKGLRKNPARLRAEAEALQKRAESEDQLADRLDGRALLESVERTIPLIQEMVSRSRIRRRGSRKIKAKRKL